MNNKDLPMMVAVAKAVSGSSGGGSSLPEVTTDDNGKFLGVTNGAWDKVNNPLPTATATEKGKILQLNRFGMWAKTSVAETTDSEVLQFKNGAFTKTIYGKSTINSPVAMVSVSANGSITYNAIDVITTAKKLCEAIDTGAQNGYISFNSARSVDNLTDTTVYVKFSHMNFINGNRKYNWVIPIIDTSNNVINRILTYDYTNNNWSIT